MKKLQKQQSGFTIIEVLIVLAIAGLIMLIVFLAVPALQRNSRNTQRRNDVKLILAAVNEYAVNVNWVVGLDVLTQVPGNAGKLSVYNPQATALGGDVVFTVGAASPDANTSYMTLGLNSKCSDSQDSLVAQNRSAAVLYYLEGTNGAYILQCVGS